MNKGKHADDAFLAACSALLAAIATRTEIDRIHVTHLLCALPDYELRGGFATWLQDSGLCSIVPWELVAVTKMPGWKPE